MKRKVILIVLALTLVFSLAAIASAAEEVTIRPDASRNLFAPGADGIDVIIPNSGNDIPANQFKTIITFDNTHKHEINGYKVTTANSGNLECKAEYSRCRVKLVWMQPMNAKFEEFTLFETEAEITLEEPTVYADNMIVKYSGNINKIKVEATGLVVLLPRTGLADNNTRPIIVSEGQLPQLKDAGGDINGFIISSQPQIVGGDMENGYMIEFELSKTATANVRSAEGAITIPVALVVRHPTNNKTSRTENEIEVYVNYTPGSTGGARTPTPTRNQPTTPTKPPAQPPRR